MLDTLGLIDHLSGRPQGVTEIIPSALEEGHELWSSYVVPAEVLARM